MGFFMTITRFLNFLDIFRFPLTLTFKRYEKNSTLIGKIFTLGIIIFLFYSFMVSDILNKKNPNILSQDLIVEKRPTIFLNRNNFTALLGIADDSNKFYVNESMYSFFACTQYSNNNKSNQTFYQNCDKLELCTQNDFIEDPTEFNRLGLNGTYCLHNKTYKLSGYWDEETVENFWFELRACENSTLNNNSCPRLEEIDSFLKDYYIDIYISSPFIDASEYENFISRSVKIFYQRIDPIFLKKMYLYLKNTIIETDEGFIFKSIKAINTYLHGEFSTDSISKPKNSKKYFEFNIYSSGEQRKIKRNYQKFQTLLAELGGILNFLFIFGFILSKVEHHYKLFSVISNEIFIFPKIEKKSPIRTFLKKINSKRNLELNECKSEREIQLQNFKENDHSSKSFEDFSTIRKHIVFSIVNSPLKDPDESDFNSQSISPQIGRTNSNKTLNLIGNDPSIPLTQSITWKEKLRYLVNLNKNASISNSVKKEKNHEKLMEDLGRYQKMKQKENFFGLGFLGFVKFIFKKNIKCFFKRDISVEEKLFSQAKEKIEESLDILDILKKLQEIERMKEILFNEDQLFFFNLLTKPLITLDSIKNKEKELLSKSIMHINKERLKEMYLSMRNKSKKSEVDKRIMALLDNDIKFFLEKEIINF